MFLTLNHICSNTKGEGEITKREQREKEKSERETWETDLREWESQGDRVEREKE